MKKWLLAVLAIVLVCAIALCIFLCLRGCTPSDDTDESNGGNGTQGSAESNTEGNGEGNTESTEKAYTRVGDKILFGSYPQSEVKDTALVEALIAVQGTLPTEGSSGGDGWVSYGYFKNGVADNYMWYKDVELGGERYRGVYFTFYRSVWCDYSPEGDGSTYQDENGYLTSNVYWFKYEPVVWSVVDEADGVATIVCDMIIDSQNYDFNSNGVGCHYASSTIRAWLNDTFINTAFTSLERSIIETTVVDNSAASTNDPNNVFACEDTEDKVFLLSVAEIDAYLTVPEARQRKNTDYARSQGSFTSGNADYSGNGQWKLRSPYRTVPGTAHGVLENGEVRNSYIGLTYYGVVPALRIKL